MKNLLLVVLFILPTLCQAKENRFSWNGKEVVYYLQEPKTPAHPTIFIIHGVKRNPEYYFKKALVLHEKFGYGIVAPGISEENFPTSRVFQFGGILDEKGQILDRKEWTFTMISELRAHLAKEPALIKSDFHLWGHSAGSQFVHRMAIFAPDENFKKYYACNAGTYTAFDKDILYPYGISDVMSLVPTETPKVKLIILAGSKDNDPKDKYLSTRKNAMKQGKHRFERAHYFVACAKNMNYKDWPILTVMPEVSHSLKEVFDFMLENEL